MSISSNAILHFTNSKETLKDILENNFRIHYCKEEISFGDGNDFHIAVPMVSFCDIPFSQIKTHMEKYGNYGIGLTKEWAKRKKLNPVLYFAKDSYLASSYINFFKEHFKNSEKRKSIPALSDDSKRLIDIVRYMKNYENTLIRGKNIYPNYRFYDEREWRYVLDFTDHDQFFYPANTDKFDKKTANKSIESYELTFEPNDIKYIIIKDESEINEFINILRNAKGRKFTLDMVEKLNTRIITSTQIIDDF